MPRSKPEGPYRKTSPPISETQIELLLKLIEVSSNFPGEVVPTLRVPFQPKTITMATVRALERLNLLEWRRPQEGGQGVRVTGEGYRLAEFLADEQATPSTESARR